MGEKCFGERKFYQRYIMDNLNNVFFEEFKRLDNLCRDIYRDCLDGRLGVTLYLHDMDSHFNQGKSLVPFWVSDYKQLKRLRNIRNELAHSQDSFSYLELTQADIDFIRKFREKILNCTDPISLLNNKNNISPECGIHRIRYSYNRVCCG